MKAAQFAARADEKRKVRETQEAEEEDLTNFCKALPKIELHAHLSGSIQPQCLHEIWQQRKSADPEGFTMDDPLEVMSPEKQWDLRTFFPLFSTYIYALCNSASALSYATTSVLADFEAAGVVYMELRSTPREFEETGLGKEGYVQMVLEAIKQYEARDETQMKTTLVLSVDRRDDEKKANECVDLAIKYFGQGVVGVDLCGDPLKGDTNLFAPIFARAKSAGLKLTFHFAEAEATSSDEELMKLLSFDPERLGHVIHVSETVKEEIKRRKLGLELCVSCNVKAKMMVNTSGGIGDHHFGEWQGSECPVVLCCVVKTDDVGVFGSPVWNEYLLVATHFGMTKKQLWQLSFEGVDTIFVDADEKRRIRKSMLLWREENMSIQE